MPKPIQTQESFVDMAFPIRGLDLSTGFASQLPGTTLVGQNVRTFERETQRARGGSRPGIKPYIPAQVPNGAHLIQHLNYVVDPGGSALLDFGPIGPPSVLGIDFVFDPSNNPLGELPRNDDAFIQVRNGGSGIQRNRNTRSPEIIWSDPADISSGTPLSSTQLNATAIDSKTSAPLTGSFTYTPPSGTVLPDGSGQPLFVLFVPDSALYRAATKTVHINVGGIAFVQGNAASDLTNVPMSSVDLAYTSSVTAGHFLIAAVTNGIDLDSTQFTVTDTLGNTWTLLGYISISGTPLLVFSTVSGSSGSNTVTFTPTAPGATLDLYSVLVAEWKGNRPSPIDGTVTNSAVDFTNTPYNTDTGTIPVSGTKEAAIAVIAASAPSTFGAFTQRVEAHDFVDFGGGDFVYTEIMVMDKITVSAPLLGTYAVNQYTAQAGAITYSVSVSFSIKPP